MVFYVFAEGILVRTLGRSKCLGICLAFVVPLFVPKVFWFEPLIGRSPLAICLALIVPLFVPKVFWFEPLIGRSPLAFV